MVPNGSMGFKHVGNPLKIETGNLCLLGRYILSFGYHKTDIYHSCIQNIKQEDFLPNDSVSMYYYPSYVVAGPYYVITTALATFYDLIAGTNEKIEQRLEIAVNSNSGQSIANNRHALDIGCNISVIGIELQFNVSNPLLPFIRDNVLQRHPKDSHIVTSDAERAIARTPMALHPSLLPIVFARYHHRYLLIG